MKKARQDHHKRLQTMSKAKTIRPDDLRAAEKLMEKALKQKLEDVKLVVERVKKGLEA